MCLFVLMLGAWGDVVAEDKVPAPVTSFDPAEERVRLIKHYRDVLTRLKDSVKEHTELLALASGNTSTEDKARIMKQADEADAKIKALTLELTQVFQKIKASLPKTEPVKPKE